MTTQNTRVTLSATAQQQSLIAHIEEAAPFEDPWDRPVRDHELDGLTVDEALARLNGALLESVYGHH